MPVNPTEPRQSVKRTELKYLEKYRLAVSSAEMNAAALKLIVTAVKQRKKLRKQHIAACMGIASALLSSTALNREMATLPRQRPTSMGPMKGPYDFDEAMFYSQFRFRRDHFYMLLQAMRWTDAAGRVRVIKFGRAKHTTSMRTDHLMMILCRRLAFPCRWVDVMLILGGNETDLSDGYNFVLRYIFKTFCPLVSHLGFWKEKFPDFAKRLADMGAPFDNLISFVDGHFDPTARPGGDACWNLNVKDYQVWNHLHKDHGLMYQGLCLVNGWCMCWGPFRGPENDAKTVIVAGIIEDLHAICQELGVTFSHFADSAYTRSRYMQAILKNPVGGNLTRAERRFNALMARFRVVIENLFAEVVSIFKTLQHKQNKMLGKQDIGKMFPVCMFLHNCRTLFYGNQVSAYFGCDGLLGLTLRDLLDEMVFVE